LAFQTVTMNLPFAILNHLSCL